MICCLFYFSSAGVAQETYNYRLSFDRPVDTRIGQIEVNDSCFYVLGNTLDTAVANNLSVLFSKMSHEGEALWHTSLSDTVNHYWFTGDNFIPTHDGNFAFATSVQGASNSWISLLKYSSNGDTIFTRNYHPALPQQVHEIDCKDLVMLEDGGFLILGRTWVPVWSNFSDMYLLRTDSLGTLLWSQTYGSDLYDRGMQLAFDQNNEIIIAGSNSNWITNWTDYIYQNHLLKIDEVGNVEWEYTSPADELLFRPKDIISTNDNGLLIAAAKGVEQEPIDMYTPANVYLYANVYKLDVDQNVEWETDVANLFGQNICEINSLKKVSDNSGFVCAGYSLGPVSSGMISDGYGIICKLDTDGDSLWTRSYSFLTEEKHRHSFSEVEEIEDGFILVGSTRSYSADSIDLPLQRAWIIKVDQHGCLVPGCHLLSDVTEPGAALDIQVNIYPNPTSDYLNVYFRRPVIKGRAVFELLDASGRSVLQFESGHGDITHMVDVSELVAGSYWLTCRVGREVVSKEVVIAR